MIEHDQAWLLATHSWYSITPLLPQQCTAFCLVLRTAIVFMIYYFVCISQSIHVFVESHQETSCCCVELHRWQNGLWALRGSCMTACGWWWMRMEYVWVRRENPNCASSNHTSASLPRHCAWKPQVREILPSYSHFTGNSCSFNAITVHLEACFGRWEKIVLLLSFAIERIGMDPITLPLEISKEKHGLRTCQSKVCGDR